MENWIHFSFFNERIFSDLPVFANHFPQIGSESLLGKSASANVIPPVSDDSQQDQELGEITEKELKKESQDEAMNSKVQTSTDDDELGSPPRKQSKLGKVSLQQWKARKTEQGSSQGIFYPTNM